MTLVAGGSFAQSYPAKAPSNPPPPASTVTACPWLTEGSAAAALGGSVKVILKVIDSTQGTCTFTKKDAPQAEIKIVVGSTNVPACPAGSPQLPGIGTKANRCRPSPPEDPKTEMISAKVRALNMAVTFSSSRSISTTGLDYRPAITIDQIAEQVAGNLF